MSKLTAQEYDRLNDIVNKVSISNWHAMQELEQGRSVRAYKKLEEIQTEMENVRNNIEAAKPKSRK